MGLIETHAHTTCSDGFSTPEEMVDAARLIPGLTHLAITDHDVIDGAFRAVKHAARRKGAPEIIVGEEVSSAEGHILGLGIKSLIPSRQSAAWTVDAIHEQGGIAIAAHPFWRPHGKVRRGVEPMGVGILVRDLPFDAIEVQNGMPLLHFHNRRATAVADSLMLVGTGGSDAHVAEGLGAVMTSFVGDTFEDFLRDLSEARLEMTTRRVLARSALAIGISFARGRRGRFRPKIPAAD